MANQLSNDISKGLRFALCIGIGEYTKLSNHNLRYAVSDAQAVAEKLQDQQRGQFEVTLLTSPFHTTKNALVEAIDEMLNGDNRNEQDLVVIYISCHGNVYAENHMFYILPSDTQLGEGGTPKRTTTFDIHDLAKMLTRAKVKNIVILLDACYSGGAGAAFQHINLNNDLRPGTNLFILGAARHDKVAYQDSNLAHGVFTYCLLRIFDLMPKRNDGWITISDALVFIAEDIKSICGDKEETLQIHGISSYVNPNIPLTKNPMYSPQSLRFTQEVQKLLQLVQYEPIETFLPKEAPANFYVTTLKSGILTKRIGIIPYYNQIESLQIEYIEQVVSFVKAQIEAGDLHEALIVTMVEISNEVRQAVKIPFLQILSYGQIWKELIDFKKYLQNLIRDYETSSLREDIPPLKKIYIPLKAEYHLYKKSNMNFGVSSKSENIIAENHSKETMHETVWQGDAEEAINRWLADPASTRLALLADYGTGKTTFCQHLAATLAKQRLESSENQQYGYRIPLMIPLLDFAKAPVDIEGFLIAYLKQRCKVINPDFEALMKMAEAGLFLFILDGFDEMASRANTDTVRQNIAIFDQLSHLSKNKVLLTTRPEYFTSLTQEQSVLYSYDRLYIQLFDDEQINLYLQKRIPSITDSKDKSKENWEYYRKQINSIHDLSDLIRRPVLLEMIIKTLPRLIDNGEIINRPNLYQHYLEGELERQRIKNRRDLQINMQKRFEIMEHLALELYYSNKIELPSSDILTTSRILLTLEQQEELEGSLREIVTCSFLIRKGDKYRFSHQSFLEYLVARHLANEIHKNNSQTFSLKPLNRTVLGFLLELEQHILWKSQITKTYSPVISFDYTTLIIWFKKHSKEKWIGTNAFSLLAKLLPPTLLHELPLNGADLSSAYLAELDLTGADLTNVNLTGADLTGAILTGADLTDAHLNGVNLTNANLTDVKMRRAYLRGAKLVNTTLTRGNLSLADLSHVDFSGTMLSQADFSYANLFGATVTDMNAKEIRQMTPFLENKDKK